MAQAMAFASQHIDHPTDSDEEIDTSSKEPSGRKKATGQSVIVAGEASESDEDVQDTSNIMSSLSVNSEHPAAPSSTPTNERTKEAQVDPKYNTILHRKLREKNEQFRKELISIACNPYNDATREIKTITQQLIRSQKMVQGVSGCLRRVSRDLLSLQQQLEQLKAARKNIPTTVYANGVNTSSHAEPAIKSSPLNESTISPPSLAEEAKED
ncbi:hypothetical protein HDE_06771 [Halotydeus destructor]|nr:hypothetical protein HDE_06771 [Halotydeus destructor]